MILLAHLLLGAAIGSKINNIPLAVILAFLSHYFLDLFPHIEYPIENIKKNQWSKAKKDILKVFIDFSLGILLILFLSKNYPLIYFCAFFAILPDGLSLLNSFIKNDFLLKHSKFHQEKIHFLKGKKISVFWRIFTQIISIIISILLIKI